MGHFSPFGVTQVPPEHAPGLEPQLRIVLRSARDIARLKGAAASVPRLPESGVRVLIDELDPAVATRLEEATRRYIQACGCAEGAAALLLVLAAAAIHLSLQILARGWRPGDAVVAGVALVAAGAAMGLAKTTAIRVARIRFERRCEEALAALEVGGSGQGGCNDVPAMGR